MICPCCGKRKGRNHFACVSQAKGGKVKSEKKARASRRNGKKGGRPKDPQKDL
jgi:hypothetical protein